MVERNITTGIDHPIIALREMTAGREAYMRLGFTVTPRGRHREWGTGNWCIMFEHDYLELRGIIDPASSHNLGEFLKTREGLMGMAFGTNDAQASGTALAERGLNPQPVRQLTRDFEVPDGPLEPRFSLCFLNAEETPGLMSVVFCQHLTPQLIRRPEWLRHPNGACGVRSLTSVVPDVANAAEHYTRVFGKGSLERKEGGFTIRLNERQSLDFVAASTAHCDWPGVDLTGCERSGCLAAVTLYVADISTTKAFFDRNNIAHVLVRGNTIRTPASASLGVPFEFTQD